MPTGWQPVPLVTTGDLWTAANHNTYIRANQQALADAIDAHAAQHGSGGSDPVTIAPSQVSPQGAGSGLDADMLDGKHASAFEATYGSNASGQYVRFPDGTQICWVYNLYISSSGTYWTYPAAFTSAPAVAGLGRGTYGTYKLAFYNYAPTATSARLALSETDARVAGYASVVAVGRWK